MFKQYAPVSSKSEKTSAREDRIDIRVGTPKQRIEHLFATNDYNPSIKRHKKFVKELCKNPMRVYSMMRQRLQNEGETVSFQYEFEGVVGFLIQYLFQDEKCAAWFSLPEQKVVRDQLIPALAGIQIETRYMYPYRATIYVIQRMLSIIDSYHRSLNEYPDYYHNFRYEYYLTMLTDVDRNDIVLLPTCSHVGSTVLIKLRCVPVHILGVVCEPTYADQYVNSPLDFWAHDVNHARRTMLETEWYYDTFVKHRAYRTQRNFWSNPSLLDFYKEMQKFTMETLLPIFTPQKGTKIIRDMKASERSVSQQQLHEREGYKALKRLLIFEITHEKAWPITPFSLLRNMVLGYDIYPVESLGVRRDSIATSVDMFDDPTTLSITINKLRGGFYDDPKNTIESIVPANFRTSTHLVTAALELFDEIAEKFAPSIQRPSRELLLALATDRHGTEEFHDGATVNAADVAPNQKYPKEDYIPPRPKDFKLYEFNS
jgi:hypothetical protein